MTVHCGRCDKDFDDEVDLSMCPHQVMESVYKPYAEYPVSVACIEELLQDDLAGYQYHLYLKYQPPPNS